MTDWSGKAALVTGAANGIGAATARAFARAGAHVLLTDVDGESLSRTARRIADESEGSVSIDHAICDVTDAKSMESSVARATEQFGGLDVAVLNAGVEGRVASIVDTPAEEFDAVLSVNLRGVFLGIKYCVPPLKARGGGAILITSSVAGVIGTAGLAPYTTSKHGVIGLMRCAALEVAEFGIRVNTVNPCPVETRMMRALEEGFSPGQPDDAYAALKESIPLQRYAEPDEVAAMFLFLASDAARFLSGGVYMVDGAMTAGLPAG